MERKRFTDRDEGFTCYSCGKEVRPLGRGCRDHCPFCLASQHVDINPGDRMHTCQGALEPVDIDTKKGEYTLVYHCKRCGASVRNKAAPDDDYDAILSIVRSKIAKGKF